MAENARSLNADATADRRLGLMPHPEGGFYGNGKPLPASAVRRADGSERAASTVIDFLLPAGVTSRWHRLIGGGGKPAPRRWRRTDSSGVVEAKLRLHPQSEA